MFRRRGSRNGAPWVVVLRQPGVLAVLGVLSSCAEPAAFAKLRLAVPEASEVVTASALRRLASLDMVARRGGAYGSWDEPNDADQYELTPRGHGFVGAIADLTSFVARLRSPRG